MISYKLWALEAGLHCFSVMARVRKVMKAATANMEKPTPTQMKNLSPLRQVRQKSWRYMMCVTRAQSASTPVRRQDTGKNVSNASRQLDRYRYDRQTDKFSSNGHLPTSAVPQKVHSSLCHNVYCATRSTLLEKTIGLHQKYYSNTLQKDNVLQTDR